MNKIKKIVCTPIATLTLIGSLIGGANAAVLTFDIAGISNFANVDQGYGDNITATTMGSFSYGNTGGFTPNVSVSYGNSSPSLWTTGYGSLSNVLFEDADSTGVMTITLSADPGFEIELHGFDLAAYNGTFSSPPTIGLVNVRGTAGSLFSAADQPVSETMFTNFSFASVPRSSELTITIDARNLGSDNDDIAIDNITFSQITVPEPSSALLLGLGTLGLLVRRRTK